MNNIPENNLPTQISTGPVMSDRCINNSRTSNATSSLFTDEPEEVGRVTSIESYWTAQETSVSLEAKLEDIKRQVEEIETDVFKCIPKSPDGPFNFKNIEERINVLEKFFSPKQNKNDVERQVEELQNNIAALEALVFMDPSRASEWRIKNIENKLEKLRKHISKPPPFSTQLPVALNDDEDDDFPEDSYSFIQHSGFKEGSFYFGIFVFLFQFLMELAIIFSIIVPSVDSNPPMDGTHQFFPGDVEPIVKTTQFLSILAYVIFGDESINDTTTAINMLPTKLEKKEPFLTQMILASSLRLIQGICAAIATFFLVFTSTTTLEVVLNFAAIAYISTLDNIAFSQAKKGYYSFTLRLKTKELDGAKLPDNIVGKQYKFLPRVMACTLCVSLSAGAIYVMVMQTRNQYLSGDMFRISFDGNSGFQEYRGCYRKDEVSFRDRMRGNRLTYSRYLGTNEPNAKFGYCKDEWKWILFVADHDDACNIETTSTEEKKLAYSSESSAFEIRDTFGYPWFSAQGIPLDIQFITDGAGVNSASCDAVLGDGDCNQILNKAEFHWDSGDCCASTCDSPFCGLGKVETAFGSELISSGDGYQNCLDPAMLQVTMRVTSIENSSYLDEPTSPPPLSVICEGRNHLRITLQEGMNDNNEVIQVKDGATCEIEITTGARFSTVNYELYIDYDDNKNGSEIEIYHGESGSNEFTIIPSCYFRKLSQDIDFKNIYTKKNSPQRRAIDWLMNSPNTKVSDCESPFFTERYTLSILTFSVIVNYQTIMDQNRDHCLWDYVSCTSGYVTEVYFPTPTKKNVGTLASELVLLTKLKNLDISNHYFGTLPVELGNLSNLEWLRLENNKLKGRIPFEFGNLSSLTHLNLKNNFLNESIPIELEKLTNLEVLQIRYNKLTGHIHSALGGLTNLKELNIGNNNLSGQIPPEIGDLTALTSLGFGHNGLSGRIPSEISNLKKLKYLKLRPNNFTGYNNSADEFEAHLCTNIPDLVTCNATKV